MSFKPDGGGMGDGPADLAHSTAEGVGGFRACSKLFDNAQDSSESMKSLRRSLAGDGGAYGYMMADDE